jgi:hypothetical protein
MCALADPGCSLSATRVGAIAPGLAHLAAVVAGCDLGGLAASNSIGITGSTSSAYAPRAQAPTWKCARSRRATAFLGIEPACGSGNGCVAALVRRDGIRKARSCVAN